MNNFLRVTTASLLMGGLMLSASVQAQEFRIGYVNLDRVVVEAATAKAAQAKLEQEFSKREKELIDLTSSLKTAADKFEREAPTSSEGQRTSRQRQLIDQDRELQRKRREFQEDLNGRKNEELNQLFERTRKVIRQVAETEKYDLILQEAVYVNPKHDITDKVLKVLNSAAAK